MVFDHSKLLGKIRECGITQEKLAKEIGMNQGTLCLKLKNKSHFTTDEMAKICKVLDIPAEEVGKYFFAK